MSSYGPGDGTCTVRVFKAGLMSAIGHDLELQVKRWSLTIDEEGLRGDFDGSSMEVAGAIKDGRVDPSGVSAKDKRDILDNLRNKVFKGFKAELIRFEAQDIDRSEDGLEGTGTLHIPPHRHDLDFEIALTGGRATCTVRLHQPDWGIRPFKAPLGVLKVQPDIEVKIDVGWKG